MGNICVHVFIIPLSFHYGWFYRDSPFLDYHNPQYIKASRIPQLIINPARGLAATAHIGKMNIMIQYH